MKKRVCSLLLALCMTAGLLVLPAGAASVSRYADVTDASTAANAEVLRLMGVMDGYGNGSFKPNVQLNRAQFCKMATYALHLQQKLGFNRTTTIFPDVKPSHWAAPYINLMARERTDGEKGVPVIAGFPDGRFHPERTINLGQAAAILVRVLGYPEGVFPDSYMANAENAGLLKGLAPNSAAPLTRAQAARLFVNLLTAQKPGGGTLHELGEKTALSSVDGGTGRLKTADGQVYTMANPVADSALVGMPGRVVTVGGKTALTFLPEFGEGTGSAAGAVVLDENESAVGLEALAGNTSYKIYKNGSAASLGDLRKYDVATYYPDTNSVLVTDTRISTFYESCEPNPQAPAKIRVLGGTEFYVLPTAVDSLKHFKPGERITLLLTADGQVAGAVAPGTSGAQGNALGLVLEGGKVELFLGSTTREIKAAAKPEQLGQVVRISSVKKDSVSLEQASGGLRGELNVTERTLGSAKLAEGAVLIEGGKQISLGQLTRNRIPAEQIRYTRTNWAGEVDLVVIDRSTGELYGIARWDVDRIPASKEPDKTDDDGKVIEEGAVIPARTEDKLRVEYGNGLYTKFVKIIYQVNNGDFVVARMNADETGFTLIRRLPKLEDISWTSWVGGSVMGGTVYEVPADVQCYNLDSEEWITLDQARAYADTADLYVKDGFVRIVVVGG